MSGVILAKSKLNYVQFDFDMIFFFFFRFSGFGWKCHIPEFKLGEEVVELEEAILDVISVDGRVAKGLVLYNFG